MDVETNAWSPLLATSGSRWDMMIEGIDAIEAGIPPIDLHRHGVNFANG
jgi:hypothetical protein